MEGRILTFMAPNATLQHLIPHSRLKKMGKGWVGEKMPLIVQNAFAPKETEVITREVGKKK